ncbi:hypothetical protein [Tenacibaculum sp. 190524A02b]|uniref:hypothetical protein n=1 Tax=Tenacibaculum vairaonense TaxID=3137860 RepID=UPI0031FA5963
MSFSKFSSMIYGDLKSGVKLVELLSNKENSIYPMQPSDLEGGSFIIYFIENLGGTTRDLANGWSVNILSFAEDYDSCCVVADAVTDVLRGSVNEYKPLGGKPNRTSDGFLYIEQKFNIII